MKARTVVLFFGFFDFNNNRRNLPRRLFLNMREETDGLGSWGRRASGLSVVATPDAGMDSSIRGRTQVLSNRGGVSRPEGFLVTEVVTPAGSRSPKP